MDAVTLLQQARADGVVICAVDGQLEIEADENKRKWIAKIRPHKRDILRHLNGEPAEAELPATAEDHAARKVAILRYKAFPCDALPEPVRSFVVAGAEAIGCDASYIALPLLTAIAAAIGNTRRIELKRGWSEPAILWTAIVGDSGTMKSPALELALRPVRDRQRRALTEHAQRMIDHRDKLLHYERDLATWKKSKGESDPPEKPIEPVADRAWADDPTIEALAVLLLNQWRGLVMIRDELAGWIASFDRYAGGKGGDVARWLEMFGGRAMVVDRKTGQPKTLYVPRAAVSVAGGIQPGVLSRALNQQYRENGLAARLLLASPPRQPKRWTDADIDPALETELAGIVDRLYELQPEIDSDDELQPRLVRLAPAARRLWIVFYNQHADEHAELSGELSAAWSKLEGYAARLALVIHFTRWAYGDLPADGAGDDVIDAESIAAGIRLSRWFGGEARRIYAMLNESEDAQDRRQLVEWIDRKGGNVTVRDLQQGQRQFATAEDAEAALNELAAAGYGGWSVESTATNKRREFHLHKPSTSTHSPKTREISESVDVDSAGKVETASRVGPDPDSDWGEL